MKAVQREDFDGLAQLLIEADHLFNFLWVGHKAGVQLLIAPVNIGDHQHHELHRSFSLVFILLLYPLVFWQPPSRHTSGHFFRAPGAAVPLLTGWAAV